jgi:hypothetical protein
MPIIAGNATTPPCCEQPANPGVTTPVQCLDVPAVSPTISTARGQVITKRLRSVKITTGKPNTIQWQLVNANGQPIALEYCASGSSSSEADSDAAPGIKLKLAESLNWCGYVGTVTGTIVDAATGLVQFELDAATPPNPGIYYAEVAALAADGTTPLAINQFTIHAENSLWNANRDGVDGPPSLAEVRLHLRDSDAAESYLLDNVMFDDAEIALAIQRPVQYWNEIPPPIQTYTTSNFPFRYHWLEAIAGVLFRMAAEQFRRNQLPYSAAGVTVDDQNKEPQYERAADARWNAWREFVQRKKGEMNLANVDASILSPYAFIHGEY